MITQKGRQYFNLAEVAILILFSYKKLIQILMMKNSGNHNGATQCIFLMAQIIQLELQYY